MRFTFSYLKICRTTSLCIAVTTQ